MLPDSFKPYLIKFIYSPQPKFFQNKSSPDSLMPILSTNKCYSNSRSSLLLSPLRLYPNLCILYLPSTGNSPYQIFSSLLLIPLKNKQELSKLLLMFPIQVSLHVDIKMNQRYLMKWIYLSNLLINKNMGVQGVGFILKKRIFCTQEWQEQFKMLNGRVTWQN